MSNIPFSGIREIMEECTRLEREGVDVIHLEQGRPDFDTPEPIKAAAKQALDDGKVHYTSNYGVLKLREKISEKFEEEAGVYYDPNGEIIVTSGATEAVFISILAFVDPGQEVLVPDPSWTYEPAIHAAGGTPVRYRLDPENGFQPDIESIEQGISSDTALLILNSPHNPTGGVVDSEHIKKVRDLATKHDLLVISDEVYEKILFGNTHHSTAAFDGMRERTITINAVSKTYSMTGWRLGYLGAPKELVDVLIRLRQFTSTSASSISQYASVRAVGSDLYEPMLERYAERRRILLEHLDDIPEITCPPPGGAFYAFPDISSITEDDESFVWSLLQEQGVALVPGRVFGENGRGHIRIAYSNSAGRIDTALTRLKEFV